MPGSSASFLCVWISIKKRKNREGPRENLRHWGFKLPILIFPTHEEIGHMLWAEENRVLEQREDRFGGWQMEAGSREPVRGMWLCLQTAAAPAVTRILRSNKQPQLGGICMNLLFPQTRRPLSPKYLQRLVFLWKRPESKDDSQNV